MFLCKQLHVKFFENNIISIVYFESEVKILFISIIVFSIAEFVLVSSSLPAAGWGSNCAGYHDNIAKKKKKKSYSEQIILT